MAKVTYPFVANPISATQTEPASIAYRPQRPVTITALNGQSVRFLAILDTGADTCVFPLSTAILLGLDVLNSPKAFTGGVGSQSNLTMYERVKIDLGDGISFETRAGFTQGLDAIGLGLLGQTGFFEYFNVEFRHSEKIFTIEPITI
jgi:hypothetical protein